MTYSNQRVVTPEINCRPIRNCAAQMRFYGMNLYVNRLRSISISREPSELEFESRLAAPLTEINVMNSMCHRTGRELIRLCELRLCCSCDYVFCEPNLRVSPMATSHFDFRTSSKSSYKARYLIFLIQPNICKTELFTLKILHFILYKCTVKESLLSLYLSLLSSPSFMIFKVC